MGTQLGKLVRYQQLEGLMSSKSDSVRPLIKSAIRHKVGKTLQALAVVLGVLLLCVPAFSQGSDGRIVGTITDSNGGAVTGATVIVLDVARGTTRTLVADDSGAYSAPNLLPGQYKVRAEFKGFKVTERQNITLEVGQEIRIDLTLQPGEQAQTITVTEEIPLVETTNAELGGTIQSAVINDLPLNGRNFENLLTLRPGVAIYEGGSGWSQSSNGLRPHDNMYLVEGVNSNDPWMAQSMMNAVMAAGDAGTILPIDAIDEFKTIQNPRAEYGWKPGAVVNVGIKSGTNLFHGSGYAYGRSDAFDAIDLYTTKVPVSLEQYGASIGGPVVKDKLFFFGNFESQQYSIGSPAQHTVPDTAATPVAPAGAPANYLTADTLVGACQSVAPANRAPLTLHLAGLDANCVMAGAPGLFPVSNGSTTLITTLSSFNNIYSGVGKMDYHLNDKNSLSGMFFMSPGSGTFVDDPTHEIDQRWVTVQYARAIVGSAGWTFTPSSTVVNSFRFGYSHYYQTFVSPDSTVNPTAYGINTGVTNSVSFGLPRIRITNPFSSFQLGGSWPKTVGPDAVTQFSDSISYLHGNHSFKFGGEIILNSSTNLATNNTKGPVQFKTLTDFFTGTLSKANISAGNFVRNLSDQGYAGFFQDDWRVTRRFTLNAGLRYEVNTVLKDKNNLIGNFSPTAGLEQVGVGGYKAPYNTDYRDFSPRLGFAWDIAGNGKTVVRGGASLLYEQGSFDSFMAVGNLYGLRIDPTGVPLYANGAQVTGPGGTINAGAITFTGAALTGPTPNPNNIGLDYAWVHNATTPLYSASPACGDGSFTDPVTGITPQPCTVLGVDQNLKTPYVTTWSLGIQRALTNTLSLDVSYVGNHATKLVGLSDLNQIPVGSGWTAAAISACTSAPSAGNCAPDPNAETNAQPYNTKYPYLSNILWLSNNNSSDYHSLQVSLTQRTFHGLSYVLGYTLSHALGESPDNWSFVTPINTSTPRELYGTTQFDTRHRFTFSTTYEIPGMNAPGQLLKGWSLNSVVTLQSGLPWGINDLTTDFSGTNQIAAPAPNGEQWNFFGNPADFTTSSALSGTNAGAGGLPYAVGICSAAATSPTNLYGNIDPSNPGCTSSIATIGAANLSTNQACNTKAAALGQAAEASLAVLGCYVSLNGKSILLPPAFGTEGNTAPNMFRSTPFYNVDFSVTKAFKFGERFNAQFRAEFFNIFNHVNLANPYGGPGGSNAYTDPSADAGASFGFQPATPDTVSSNPVLGSGGARAIQLGLKLTF
jgi:Carboxypeptidase regulatory-like domain/TonB dependent receptor